MPSESSKLKEKFLSRVYTCQETTKRAYVIDHDTVNAIEAEAIKANVFGHLTESDTKDVLAACATRRKALQEFLYGA